MSNRGIYESVTEDGLVAARFNNRPILLKPERCLPYVAEAWQPREDLLQPSAVAELAKAAIINTIEIADPADSNTIWGFVTEASFRYTENNGLFLE